MRDLNRELSTLPTLLAAGLTRPGYEYLLQRGVPADRLDDMVALLDLRYDEQTRRVAFPVREAGKDLGYAARSIEPRQRKRWLSYPVEGGHKTTIYEADRVAAGGDTLFIVEGPFDALMVTAALPEALGGLESVATALFGSLPSDAQLALLSAAVAKYRMVYVMLDANVPGRCRRLASQLRDLAVRRAAAADELRGCIRRGGDPLDVGAAADADERSARRPETGVTHARDLDQRRPQARPAHGVLPGR
jgi:hypothetical protein